MRSPLEIEKELQGITTVKELSTVFEGIASMRIAQIKNQVQQSQSYFDRLWQVYTQIRVGSYFHFGRQSSEGEVSDKELIIAITGEGGFSGDVDLKLIKRVIKYYKKDQHEIIVIGHHGALQLAQNGVHFLKYFKLPARDRNINVAPIIREVQQYRTTSVFYQSYVSLTNQQIKSISLSRAVESRGEDVTDSKEVISEETYIFEPSMYAVVDHLERSMMNIALSQVILESKLAQYASRFRAMSAAHTKSQELVDDFTWSLSRAKRSIKDERLKEITNGVKKRAEVLS